MIFTQLASQMKSPAQGNRLRWWAVTATAMLLLCFWTFKADTPQRLTITLGFAQLGLALMVGGSLTGWRVTQLPKTRASEFFLVTPVSEWEIVGAELLSGMLRSAYVVGAAAPVAAFLWGAGWLTGPQVFALLVLPTAVGWAAGVSVAVVAYQPVWVRKIWEKIFLAMLVGYLVLFGLMGMYVVPLLNRWLIQFTGYNLLQVLRAVSPARLLDAGTPEAAANLWFYATLILLGALLYSAFGGWLLRKRLRGHYLEEIFGQQRPKKDYLKPVGDDPLSWWTVRRVSRFKGRINLYLGWSTILLYSVWLLAGDLWPAWMGAHSMIVMQKLGGSPMLAGSAVQFGLVPAAFLSGLWDSTVQLRIGRLELLLTTPLEPVEYLRASWGAVWTRAKGYFLAALFMLLTAWIAGDLSALGFVCATAFGANYIFFYFAVVFRSFARVAGDRAAATMGLGMAVCLPMLTAFLLVTKFDALALATPLGGMCLAARPEDLAVRTQLLPWAAWSLLLTTQALYFASGVLLIRRALDRFDIEIREWFSQNLSLNPRKSKPKTKDPVESNSDAELALEATP